MFTHLFQKAPKPTLKDISFSVEKGELLAVVGEVGCGKVSTIYIYTSAHTIFLLMEMGKSKILVFPHYWVHQLCFHNFCL